MSAFGPKQTYASAPHMSAFGGKADVRLKRDNLTNAHMRQKASITLARPRLITETLVELFCSDPVN